jgi:hypothetical protein
MTDLAVFPVDEPLAELAGFAFDWAHCLCDPKAGCFHYHRAWSIVRHIEVGGALPSGEAFFGRALRGLARDGRIRVLLSGAADTGLAAMVLKTLRPHGIEPEMVLVDRCLTTLEQNRLFARHAGFRLQTIQMDAAVLDVPAVDAIVVHSFLGFFAPESRQPVVDMWARNLARHGRVLISNRLSTGEGTPRPAADPAALARRKAMVAANATALGYSPARAAKIAAAAEALWQVRHGNPQLGEAEMMGLLDRAGLAVVEMQKDPTGNTVSPIIMDADAKRRDRAEMVVAHAG